MNAIVSFPSMAARAEFLERARTVWPELVEHSVIPSRRPDAVFESLEEKDLDRLQQLVGDNGRVFPDVKFEPFSG
jgi:hypothetical protein